MARKRNRLALVGVAAAAAMTSLAATSPGAVGGLTAFVPLAQQAPDGPANTKAGGGGNACVTPAPEHVYPYYHCYTAQEITAAYGVDTVHANGLLGQGQTIVLVDSYGSPTAAADLKFFHDTFYASLPAPDFEVVCPESCPDYKNVAKGNGQSGPISAAGWAGEATLDIEWAYAIAPRAHIVLLAVPPAETEGVQGFPNLFKAMDWAIDHYPAGTIFSQSFGVTEQTFGGAQQTQTSRFDATYQRAAAKGDTVLASSGDDGTYGVAKQHRESRYYDYPTVGWPASSPYVTAVGGTQLQYNWTWAPTSDQPFLEDGSPNPAYFAYTNGGNHEPVWNETWLPAATGGGPSAIYPRPSWQSSVASRIPGNHRAIPDVAWNAAVNGGVLVYTSFFPNYSRVGWHVYGGTSASSPQVAGLVALVNQSRAGAGKGPVGHLAPRLYQLPSSAFRDVVPTTEGTADSGKLVDNTDWQYAADGLTVEPTNVAGWPVRTGWDMTTGFGTPKAAAFVSALTAQP